MGISKKVLSRNPLAERKETGAVGDTPGAPDLDIHLRVWLELCIGF
jgi:hypothetical protein